MPEHIGVTANDLDDPEQSAAFSCVLSRIGDRWAMLAIIFLGDGPRRFSDLRRSIGGVSQRMLTLTLRKLERDGFVHRTVEPTSPPKVTYALTELGGSLRGPVAALGGWVLSNRQRMEAARRSFDAADTGVGAARI